LTTVHVVLSQQDVLADLEPTHVEDELQKGEDWKLKVADEAVVQLASPDQAGQHEYVHRYRRYL